MNCLSDNRILLESDLMIKLETEVPTIEEQLFNDNLNPDITGTLGLFREWAMLSGKITQFMNNQEILYSDKDIEYTSEPLKLADSFEFSISNDDNFKHQSKNVYSTADKFNRNDFLIINSKNAERADSAVKNNCWVSRCGIFCSVCKQKYPNKFDFDKHYLQTHVNNTEIVYTCSLCNEEDVNYNRFRNHCYRHFVKGRIKCSHCPTIRFTQDRHLLGHMKLFHETCSLNKPNTVIKPSNPTERGIADTPKSDSSKAFCDKTDILCGLCKMKCAGKILFNNHFQKMHPRSQVIYTCPDCTDEFDSFQPYKIHCNTQHNKSKVSCSDDRAGFNHQKNYFKHTKAVHDDESEVDALLYLNLNAKDSNHDTTRDIEKYETWEFKDTKHLVQKGKSNVDIKNGTNIGNCIKLETFCENISDIFSSDENQNINLQVQYKNDSSNKNQNETEISDKVENNSSWCSQSVMSESDLSDLISNMDDVNGLDSEINDWRTYIGILCGKCNQKFSIKNAFDDHFQLEHDKCKIIYTCPLCKCEHDNYDRFRGHCYRHFTKDRFKCCYCSNRFPKLYRLSAHIKAVHPESRRPEGLLLDHMPDKFFSGNMDSQWQPTSIRSPESNYSSEVISEYQSSGRNTEGKGQKNLNTWLSCYGIFCCKCKMKFLDKLSFQAHFRERHSETNIVYTCSLCSQEYDNYKCFSNHCLRHFNRGSYKCKLCPKSFSKFQSFSTHMKEVHSDDNKKIVTFVCNFCNKIYLTQDRLNLHKMSSCPSDSNSVCSAQSKHSKISNSPAKVYISSESSVENSIQMYNSSNSNTKSDYFFMGPNTNDAQDGNNSVLTDINLRSTASMTDESSRKSCNWLIYYGILCVKCKQKFPGKNLFVSHYQKVHPECDVLYTCSVCIEEFKTYRTFISHGYRHFVRGRLKCHYCPILFSHPYQLEAHLKAYNSDKSHIGKMKTDQDERDITEADTVELSQTLIRNNGELDENFSSNPIMSNFDNIENTKLNIAKIKNFSHDMIDFSQKVQNNEVLNNNFPSSPTRQNFNIKDVKLNRTKIKNFSDKLLMECVLLEEPFYDERSKGLSVESNLNVLLTDDHTATVDDISTIDCASDDNPVNVESIRQSHLKILCRLCKEKFSEKAAFDEHFNHKHSDWQIIYACSLCECTENTYDDFIKHLCNICDLIRKRKPLAKSDNWIRSSGILCGICDKKFIMKYSFLKHYRESHSNCKLAYSCSWCKKDFENYENFRGHCYRHSVKGRFKCRYCPTRFTKLSRMSAHVKTIHCDKKRQVFLQSCKICNISFSSRSHLNLHSRSCQSAGFQLDIPCKPNEEKSVLCLLCNEMYKYGTDFQRHTCNEIKNVCLSPTKTLSKMVPRSNQSLETSMYSCQLCNSVFQSCDELELHYIVCKFADKCDTKDIEDNEQIENTFCHEIQEEFKTYRVANRVDDIGNDSTPQLLDSFSNELEEFKAEHISSEFNFPSRLENIKGNLSPEVDGSEKACSKIMCGKCKQAFSGKVMFDKHFEKEHEGHEVVYACAVCDREYRTYHSFRFHRYRHMGRFLCSQCPSRFSLQSSLSTHMARHHSNDGLLMHACHLCNKHYHTEPGLKLHIRSRHTDSHKHFKCELCGNVLHSKNGFLLHMESHKLGLQFMCHICGLRFKQKINMIEHVQYSHRKLQFTCHSCPKSYHRKSYLTKHIAQQHSNVKKQCKVCSRWYRNEYCLRKHSLIHVERPHACTVCGKRFLSSAKLKQHTNTHTGLRPHRCQFCQKTFTNFPNLLKHNKRQHKHVNRHEVTLDPNNDTEKDPSLYDKNWMQPTISALDDSIQSVIITSENLKHSVIKKSYEVKDRNKDIVSCSKLSTDSSLELSANYEISDSESGVSMASQFDSVPLYSEILENQLDPFSEVSRSRRGYTPDDLQLGHDDILPLDGWQKVNLRDITLDILNKNNHSNETSLEMQTKQNADSFSDGLFDKKLSDRINLLPSYWADTHSTNVPLFTKVQEATRQSTQSESNKQTENIQNEIFKELLGNIDFLIEEEIPPNIFFKDEIETEELLSRNLRKQDHELTHNREQERAENNHAFDLSTNNMASMVPFPSNLTQTDDSVTKVGRSRKPLASSNPTFQLGLQHVTMAQLSPIKELDGDNPVIHSTEQLSGNNATKQCDMNIDTIVEQPMMETLPWVDTNNEVLTINLPIYLSTSPVISNANDLKYSIHRNAPDHTPISPLPPHSFNSPFTNDQDLYEHASYIADAYDICAGSDAEVNHAMPNEIDQRIVNCSPSLSCNNLPDVSYDCFIDNLDFGFHFTD